MSELEPGHPDLLREQLTNWLNQGFSPIGTLPAGVTPVEWAVGNFIGTWRAPIRSAVNSIEASLERALQAIKAGDGSTASFEIECARQTIGDDIRAELGLFDWNDSEENPS